MTIIDDEPQGYPEIYLDILFARTVTIPLFEGFTARRTKPFPIQSEHLPFLGIYFVKDAHDSDGDPNHGVVRFKHLLTYGFSVQMQDNDPIQLQSRLLRAYRAIFENLWRDQYMMNLLYTYNPHTGKEHPENLRIEGIQRGRMEINWGTIGQNETPWAELQFEPVLILRTYWEPYIPDDLLEINVEAVPMVGPPGERHPADEYVKRILLKYQFDPETGPRPPPLS